MNRLTPPGGVRLPNPSQMGNYNSPTSQQGPQSNQPPPPSMGMRGQPPQGPPSLAGPNVALSPMPQMNIPPNQGRWSASQQSSGPNQVNIII